MALKIRCVFWMCCVWQLFAVNSLSAFSSHTFSTPAKQAVLIDYHSGAVLLEKDAYDMMTPSSMTKIMTIYLVFEALNKGVISLDTSFTVSEKAWKQKGSRMFVEVAHDVLVKDLIQGTIVSSGNDSSIVLAEGLAGSEQLFSQQMTKKAQSIGATKTVFLNSNGWPIKGHHSSAYDLALIARSTIKEFPSLYKQFYSQQDFTYNNIKQYNHNKLLFKKRKFFDVDGLKTGHTSVGGYGLVFSATKGDARFIGVINGLDSAKARTVAARNILQWAFHTYTSSKIVKKNEIVLDVPIQNGELASLPLASIDDYYYSYKLHQKPSVTTEIKIINDKAPIKVGDHLATLQVVGSSLQPVLEIPLYAQAEVKEQSIIKKYYRALMSLVKNEEIKTLKELQSDLSSKFEKAITLL